MKLLNLKNGMIAGFLILVISVLLFKCNTGNKTLEPEINPVLFKDTVFLNQWRKEKKEKQALLKNYETKISELQNENKKLNQSFQKSKQQLFAYRNKADSLQKYLQSSLLRFSVKDSSINDTIVPLITKLNELDTEKDKQCDTAIALYEKEICKKDSIINYQQKIEVQLKEFNTEQDLQNTFLTNQLNTVYKQQKKKNRQTKFLSIGMLFLTGVVTSYVFIQTHK